MEMFLMALCMSLLGVAATAIAFAAAARGEQPADAPLPEALKVRPALAAPHFFVEDGKLRLRQPSAAGRAHAVIKLLCLQRRVLDQAVVTEGKGDRIVQHE